MCVSAALPEQTEQGSCHRQLEQGSSENTDDGKAEENIEIGGGFTQVLQADLSWDGGGCSALLESLG